MTFNTFNRSGAGRLAPVVATAVALALAGCASFSKSHFTVGSVPSTYKTKHPIIIDEKEQTLDVPVAQSSYDLPKEAVSAVEGFARRYSGSASGAITVMIPAGSANEAAARKLTTPIIGALGRSGVPQNRVRLASYDASGHGVAAPVRLSYHAITASVKDCGEWPDDLAAPNNANVNYHNFGCASQNNLAAIIANPADLLGPRGTTEVDATRRGAVIDGYRQEGQGPVIPPSTLFER